MVTLGMIIVATILWSSSMAAIMWVCERYESNGRVVPPIAGIVLQCVILFTFILGYSLYLTINYA